MRFSNERFLDIHPDDFVAQRAQLSELSDKQSMQLLVSYAARRVINSHAITNRNSDKTPLTDKSLVYPFRDPRILDRVSAYEDIGSPRPSNLLDDPLFFRFGIRNAKNYVAYIGRREPETPGSRDTCYAAGLILDQETATAMNRERYIPFAGVHKSDLIIIDLQLAEIARFAEQQGLGIVDPLTLRVGEGLVLRHEDPTPTHVV